MSKGEAGTKNLVVYLQDALRHTVERQTEGFVTVLYDDTGIPSYMLRIPRFNVESIDSSLGSGPHPAFSVNGKIVDEIFVGQVNAKIIGGRAYSLPGEQETRNITFDRAREACAEKGKGWHLITAHEYAALIAWVVKKRPRFFEKEYWEWTDGMKLVNGEIFVPRDNDFALPETEWPSLGVFFDDVSGKPVLAEKVNTYTEKPDHDNPDHDGNWTSISEIADLKCAIDGYPLMQEARETLARLFIEPAATPILEETSGSLFVRNYGERLPLRGGYWDDGAGDGLAALGLSNRRAISYSTVGFRPAFIGI
jgi:hypothetical protein